MERKRAGSSNWKVKQSWKEDTKMVKKCPHLGKANSCDPPKRAAMFLWKTKLSKFSSKVAKYTKVRNVENGNSAHMMGKAKVCAPKRSALGMLPNFHNYAANTTKDMDDGVMLHMAIDIPRVDHSRNVDLDRVLPGVGDKVRERSMMMAGHCVTESLTLVTSKMVQWEPIQGTPRRRKRRTASNNTAALLMNERKVRRAAILETRRTGVTNPSTETTLDQKHRVAVVNSPQLASVQASPQVAPSTVPEQPAEPVMDIDAGDSDMPQLCSEYVKDIYAHLMDLEVQQAVRPGYLKGCDITAHMRSLLIGWLILIRSRFHLLQETLYLTVAILDRFLQVQPVSRKLLQLVGVTAMLLAAKYEEKAWGTDTPRIQDFANITDNTFTPAQIIDMEQVMLMSLDFELGRPVPSHFLRRASKAANVTMKTLTLSNYLMELTLLDYDMVHYRPSEIAAASLCLSQLLDGLPWTPAERYYTTYDETHLVPIMQHIAKNVVFVNKGRTEFQTYKQHIYTGRQEQIFGDHADERRPPSGVAFPRLGHAGCSSAPMLIVVVFPIHTFTPQCGLICTYF